MARTERSQEVSRGCKVEGENEEHICMHSGSVTKWDKDGISPQSKSVGYKRTSMIIVSLCDETLNCNNKRPVGQSRLLERGSAIYQLID